MDKVLPKLDLTTFILSISAAAFMGLGIAPPGPGEEAKVDLEVARQNIDILELIYEKTKGNRSADEDRLIEQLLFETRMRYVEIERRSSKK